MKRYRKKRGARRALILLGVLSVLPFAGRGWSVGLPYLEAAAEKLAVWSAEATLPEGGKALLRRELLSSESETAPLPQVAEPGELPAPAPTDSSEKQESSAVPERPADAGTIVRKNYAGSASSIQFELQNGGWVKNLTDHPASEVQAVGAKLPAFTVAKNGEPQVLIMHTHTTESYERQTLDWYDPGFNSRTTDTQYNVCRVGDEIEKQLQAAGIGVLHDRTLHDYPTFPGCYDRSAVTVQDYLKKYPSIRVVLDVHRDAIEQKDGTRIAPVAEVNGKNTAQVMIISGCDDGTMNYPNYFENFKLAALLQGQMEADYPGLARPILFDYRKYNQHLTTGSLLLEMGGHANSMEEVLYAGELVGKSLARALEKIAE